MSNKTSFKIIILVIFLFIFTLPAAKSFAITAQFDFNKCTFKITLKHDDIIPLTGTIPFSITFGDFDQAVNVVLS
ncbi:MAG: hypothetical protein JW860_03910 [Sedimentisphaerales bacterium]|nr:hypothetical protein [Sedimentisphaerales bacterium]